MGCTGSRNAQSLGLNDIETYITEKEENLNLEKIPYAKFVSVVKRFGYRGDLNEQQLKVISQEIGVDFAELLHNDRSIYSVYYFDQKLTYKDGRFKVPCLLLIGFMHCYHDSPEQ